MTSKCFTVLLAILIHTTVQQTNVCLRNKYIGGPQNTIIKAQELLNSLLQVSNVSTTVLYYGSKSSVNALTGEASTYYVFKINDTSNTTNPSRLLIMKITTYQNNTFVDDFLFIPAPITTVPASITYVNALIAAANFNFSFVALPSTNADYFAVDSNAQPCNLNKEYFTYFYQLFGGKFKKDLNK